MAAAVEDQGNLTVGQKADGFAGGNAGLEDNNWKEEAGARAVGCEGSLSCCTDDQLPHLDILIEFERITAACVVWMHSSRLDPMGHFDGNLVCGIAWLDIREG
jgi:hypothetical protein